VALLNGTDSSCRDEYISLTAHLDHLGKQGDVIFQGANDDASGCAVVLEIAEALAAYPCRRSVIFILFTAEEVGHYGSLHFLTHPPVPLDQILLNINLEQIGAKTRMIDGVWAIGPPVFKPSFLSLHKYNLGIELRWDDVESQIHTIQGSDTWSFYLKSVPAVLLGSGGFPEHHTPEDNLDVIDFEHLFKAAKLVHNFIKVIVDISPLAYISY
jgi:Zn-dependent M28 family amino/carboxypeptidase